MITVECATESDTETCGGRLASSLGPGDIVILSGDLGTGKTVFTRGIATGLGVDEPVMSPSFVLVREYRSGFVPMFHADVYRLGSMNEFDDLDLVAAASDGVLVIEWGGAVQGMLPKDHLRVEFEVADDSKRVLRFVPQGSWAGRDLRGVR